MTSSQALQAPSTEATAASGQVLNFKQNKRFQTVLLEKRVSIVDTITATVLITAQCVRFMADGPRNIASIALVKNAVGWFHFNMEKNERLYPEHYANLSIYADEEGNTEATLFGGETRIIALGKD